MIDGMSEGDSLHPQPPPAEPRFSIVSAVYNVGRYLDAFIASLDAQNIEREAFEVIVVDDGSTDDSLERLRAWEAADGRVRVLTKANGGQSSARNLGIGHARGQWITFIDPDDTVAPNYFNRVARFIDANPSVQMIGAHRLIHDDATGAVTNTHPLRVHFRDGDRLRDLRQDGDYFFGSAPAAFFRLEVIEKHEIRFDDRVRPNFEDGHFCCRYLLAVNEPVVGFLKSARYYYRKRADGSSTLQSGRGDPRRYTDVLEFGYLRLLRDASPDGGYAPEWLQSFVIYELSWYLSGQETIEGLASGATGALADRFHELMGQITSLLDPTVLELGTPRALSRVWRAAIEHGYRSEPWYGKDAVVTAIDEVRGLIRISYLFTGEKPAERFTYGGRVTEPVAAKIRDCRYHDRILVHERILWFPSRRTIRIQLNGHDLPIHVERPFRQRALRPWRIRAAEAEKRGEVWSDEDVQMTRGERLTLWLSRTWPVRRRFRDAWTLMDRVHDADDNGERLFAYLRAHRREINAWFVIERGTPDWHRLRKQGHRRRVVAMGSLRWKLLMLNCAQLISAHADEPIVQPPALANFPRQRWRFAFLQHGVIKDDLSVWLNRKPIEVFVTSTRAEYDSVAGDHTTYLFTGKETVLTGLPRFDRLREIGAEYPAEKRDLVLVVPTWRQWLVAPLASGSQRRQASADVLESEFVTEWLSFLRSDDLRDACAAHGLTVGFLPHPNLQALLPELDLPDHVLALKYAGEDVQHFFARAAVMVTDYSSVAFNAAYIDRPVVYLQFDADRMFGGEHVGRGGYFQYSRDGFGPVTETVEEAVAETVAALGRGRAPAAEYAARIQAAFGERDGRCCERVTEAILESGRPYRVGE